jgi:hypothetical protein
MSSAWLTARYRKLMKMLTRLASVLLGHKRIEQSQCSQTKSTTHSKENIYT